MATGTLALYSAPVVGIAVMWHMVGFYYLKYATDVLAIAPATVGLIFGSARLWDAVSDPLVGYASDRTRSRLGRRRPWMLAAGLPLPLCFAAMWWPVGLEGGALVGWVAASTFLFYTGLTVFRIPHLSLGAALARGAAERTRLFAGAGAADVAGGLIGIGVLVLVVQGGAPGIDARSAGPALVPYVVAAVSLLTAPLLLACSLRLREPAGARSLATGPFVAFADVWRNPHARPIVAGSFLPALGLICASTTAPYLADYVLGRPGLLAAVLFTIAVGALAALGASAPLSRRFTGRRLWLWARGVQGVAMLGYFWAPQLGVLPLLGISLVVGFGEGLGGVVMRTLQARVIDWDAGRSGQRKEGTYFAVWNLAAKAALGVAVLAIGVTLQLAGFRPGAEQSAESLLAIRLLMSAVPGLCLLAAVLAMTRLRLSG